MLKKIILTTILLGFGFLGCGSTDETEEATTTDNTDTTELTATLSSIQENIFTPTCAVAGCHTSTSHASGMSLKDGETYDNLVGISSSRSGVTIPRVTAGDSSASYLINKLEGTQSTVGGGSSSQMPLALTPLTAAQIAIIKEWIDNGAENN